MATQVKHVLVVGSPEFTKLERTRLEREGHHVATARTFDESVAVLACWRADLVLTAHELPEGLTGLELETLLKASGHRMPVLKVPGRGDAAPAMAPLRAPRREPPAPPPSQFPEWPKFLDRTLVHLPDPFSRRLFRAIAHDELHLHYQPIVETHSEHLIGVEALLRWHDPEYGMIPPDTFIPTAEESGLIHGLTLWVINQVLVQIQAWDRMGAQIPVAINLSPFVLEAPEFPDQVAELLKTWHVRPESMTFELTEGRQPRDPKGAKEVLLRLQALGCQLSLDDFGTAFSSLDRLLSYPAGEIKIDRFFVSKLSEDSGALTIIRSMVELAHQLGKRVVAEGVETREALDLLALAGCDTLQGYYFSRPVPASEIIERWHGVLS